MEITDYYAECGGQRAVDRLLAKIVEKQHLIESHPLAFHPEPLLRQRAIVYRSVIINKHYKMIYTVAGDVIMISAFWDMRMHPDRLKRRI